MESKLLKAKELLKSNYLVGIPRVVRDIIYDERKTPAHIEISNMFNKFIFIQSDAFVLMIRAGYDGDIIINSRPNKKIEWNTIEKIKSIVRNNIIVKHKNSNIIKLPKVQHGKQRY